MQLETGTKVYHSPSVQSMIHRTYSTPQFDLLRSVILSVSFIWALALSWIPLYNTYPTPSYHPTYTHIHTTQNPVGVIYHTSHYTTPTPSIYRFAPLSHHHQSHSPFEWFPSSIPPTPHTCFHCIVYWLTLIDPKHTLIHASCDWYHNLAAAHLA